MEFVSEINQGKVRERQEDTLGLYPPERPVLFAVADGLGGHENGDVASQTCIRELLEAYQKSDLKKNFSLKRTFSKCNRALWVYNAEKPPEKRMATTLSAAYFRDETLHIAHVGDSRIYRLRNKKIKLLTVDHAINDHTLTQAMGLEQKVYPQVRQLKVKAGDTFLICSDGLYGMATDARMLEILNQNETLAQSAKALVCEALERGGYDNIALILIRI